MSETMIHPAAVVEPGAEIGEGCQIGPSHPSHQSHQGLRYRLNQEGPRLVCFVQS